MVKLLTVTHSEKYIKQIIRLRPTIKIGDRFSNCVVLGSLKHKTENKTVYKCRCDCGSEFTAYRYRLHNKITTSCGVCKRKLNGSLKIKDIAGLKFGRLTVLNMVRTNSEGKAIWFCRCECGEKVNVKGKALLNGASKSCGCLRSDKARENRYKLEGRIFGRLTVKKYTGKSKYNCLCECGAEISKDTTALLRKKTVYHCGSDICSAEPNFIGPILSFKVALSMGWKQYSDGKLCKNNHRSTKWVSSMGCVRCNYIRTKSFYKGNPERRALVARNYNSKSRNMYKRNTYLKERRDSDSIYRYVSLVRNRLKKVLRTSGFESPSRSPLTRETRQNLLEVLKRQRLDEVHLQYGPYELDHVKPLATFPWSSSITANSLISKEANGVKNLQFLTKEEHRAKTARDSAIYKWSNKKAYIDHTDAIIYKISNNKELPTYFIGFEEQILAELLDKQK